MGQLLPRTPSTDLPERESRVIRVEDTGESADETFQILSSTTARSILTTLYDDPGPASDIAERTDTSIQNVNYHLKRLRRAGLVEPVDTWYSSRGVEMDVYAPTNDPLVITVGDKELTVQSSVEQ